MTEIADAAATPPVGLFLIGARGSVSTCVTLGVLALRSGRIDRTGLVTARAPFAALPLADPGAFHIGGLDVRTRPMRETALDLGRLGLFSTELVTAEAAALDAVDARVGAGHFDQPDVPSRADGFERESVSKAGMAPRERIAAVQAALAKFRKEVAGGRIVVVNLASTEVARPVPDEWKSLAAFERALDAGATIPASTLYAYAALAAGVPYVNFTPSLGAKVGAIEELARARRVPHAGCDGKTGETLVKTVLGPMFRDRNLRVLAWEGYNMLGGGDGATLEDPAHKAGKVANKDEALRKLLGETQELHTHVGIDYVPSLGDWKTAMDFIQFRGFLGTRMTLQFTWSASDSALAAPLVIDLVRLVDFAHRRGEAGALGHLAAFFKSPLGSNETDFYRQNQLLEEYARAAAR